MKFGYKGTVLEVDLTAGTFQVYELGREQLNFIGGAGINAFLLYKHARPFVPAIHPDNPLIFGAGPLVGTAFPTSARSTFTSISPLTEIFGDSNCGGLFGVSVKRSGYDHIVIKGKSERPCVLVIGPKGLSRIEDTPDLWGKDTLTTERLLKYKYPQAVIASIGPAGENLVRYACIMTNRNRNSYSRAGMGAVMGSKNLKAIVALGGEKVSVKRPEELKRLSETVNKWTKTFAFPKLFSRYGTVMFINMLESKGLMYAENWRRKIDFNDIVSLDAGAYLEAADSKAHGCFRCPLGCGKQWRIKTGPFEGEEGHNYEVAYLMALGLTLGFRDIPAILHLVNKLNLMGIDINEFSGTVGMAIDAQKQGILTGEVTDGLILDWGKLESIEELIDKIAFRRGFGAILAEGTKKAAAKIGGAAGEYALHMKGMHWPAHSAPPFVLAFSVSTRGGDFLKGVPHLLLQSQNRALAKALFDAEKETLDIHSHTAKGRAVWWHENYKLLTDCLGICFYLTLPLLPHHALLPEHLAQAYHYATGIDMNGKDLQIAAERGYQVERAINTLRGCDRRHDSFTRRPEPDSWAQGIDLQAPGMLDEYYSYRGLSPKGLPTKERLKELNLDELASDLEKRHLVDSLNSPEKYFHLDRIVKNPIPGELDKGIRSKLEDKIMTIMMGQMGKKPENLRNLYRLQGKRRKEKS